MSSVKELMINELLKGRGICEKRFCYKECICYILTYLNFLTHSGSSEISCVQQSIHYSVCLSLTKVLILPAIDFLSFICCMKLGSIGEVTKPYSLRVTFRGTKDQVYPKRAKNGYLSQGGQGPLQTQETLKIS